MAPNRLSPRIVVPRPEDTANILHLRTTVFCEEAIMAGVDREAVEWHTKDWQTPDSIADYTAKTLLPWTTDPNLHLRTLVTNGVTTGLIMGKYGWPGFAPNYIHVLQLSAELRGQGWGRALLENFSDRANPALPTELDVLEGNRPAIGFYRHVGFTCLGPIGWWKPFMTIADEQAPIIRMQKLPTHRLLSRTKQ